MKLRFSPTSPYVRKVRALAIESGIASVKLNCVLMKASFIIKLGKFNVYFMFKRM